LLKLRQVSTATLTSQLIKVARLRSRSPRDIRPLNAAKSRFVGPAVTLRYAPLREDLERMADIALAENPTRMAIEESAPGSVVVVDMGGDIGGGAIGDILAARLIYRGIVGLVADGAMRDAGPLMAMDLPVHCRTFTPPPNSASILAVGFNEPIGCGGVLVVPGDIVVTSDVPLAHRCVTGGVTVIAPNGREFTPDSIGMALAVEPSEPDIMRQPPRRPGKRLLGKIILWRCFFVSTVLVVLVLGLYEWGNVAGLSVGRRRAEAFNAFNNVNFFNPSLDGNTPSNFGEFRQVHPPRVMQFALRYEF
jgi:regulator of RNase E activity RraA